MNFIIDNLQVSSHTAINMRKTLEEKLGRKVKDKELGKFIAQVLQRWADNMVTLLEIEKQEKK